MSGAMPAPAPRSPPDPDPFQLRQALPHLPLALGVVLLFQQYAPQAAPPVFLRVAASVVRGQFPYIGAVEALLGMAPWLLFTALHVGLVRLLRAHGQLGLGDGQVEAMALAPGYNLRGSVELLAAEGEALVRLGGQRPGLPARLRRFGTVASALAAAHFALALFHAGTAGATRVPSAWLADLVALLWLATAAARIMVLVLLRSALRVAVALPEPPDTVPVPTPRPLRVWAVASSAALCLLAPAAARWALEPDVAPSPPEGARTQAPEAPPAPAPARGGIHPPFAALALGAAPNEPPPALASERAPTPAPSPAPAVQPRDDVLVGGRTLIWWTQRLRSLGSRSDEEGRRLYGLTKERATANGLTVREEGGLPLVEIPDALRGALEEAAR